MDPQQLKLRPNQQAFVERFVKACEADDRVVAAFLGGSSVKGYADPYSDVDLCVITTDPAFEEFFREREAFLRSLGELVFLTNFDTPNAAFYIYGDDTEGELNFSSEGRLEEIHSGPFHILLDKKHLLEGAEFPERVPAASEQMEKLRGQVHVFWHELSHFITAMQRGQIWWARGQLESLRSICVNLARLQHNILDADVGEEAYFKIETVMPVEQLSALKETFCPMEKESMLAAALVIVRFYLELAPALAQKHEVPYSHSLERVMMDRLKRLQDEWSGWRV
jgi:predicted nucleotidyltransferase